MFVIPPITHTPSPSEIQRKKNTVCLSEKALNSYYETFDTDPFNFAHLQDVITPNFWENNVLSYVFNFNLLEYNWDGYNAEPVSDLVLQNVKSVISSLPTHFLKRLDSDDIFPNSNGTISIEWERANNIVGLEIGEETMSYFVVQSGIERFVHCLGLKKTAIENSIQSLIEDLDKVLS